MAAAVMILTRPPRVVMVVELKRWRRARAADTKMPCDVSIAKDIEDISNKRQKITNTHSTTSTTEQEGAR